MLVSTLRSASATTRRNGKPPRLPKSARFACHSDPLPEILKRYREAWIQIRSQSDEPGESVSRIGRSQKGDGTVEIPG